MPVVIGPVEAREGRLARNGARMARSKVGCDVAEAEE